MQHTKGHTVNFYTLITFPEHFELHFAHVYPSGHSETVPLLHALNIGNIHFLLGMFVEAKYFVCKDKLAGANVLNVSFGLNSLAIVSNCCQGACGRYPVRIS